MTIKAFNSLPSGTWPWLRWRWPRLRCRCWCALWCRCSAWLCCSCCVSSGRSGGWRERTSPAQRRGSRQEEPDRKNLACLCRCPKKNGSYDQDTVKTLFVLHLSINFRWQRKRLIGLLHRMLRRMSWGKMFFLFCFSFTLPCSNPFCSATWGTSVFCTAPLLLHRMLCLFIHKSILPLHFDEGYWLKSSNDCDALLTSSSERLVFLKA